MAYFKDLPIWRDAMCLVVEMELALRGFLRYHKYTLSTELRDWNHHSFGRRFAGAGSLDERTCEPLSRLSAHHSTVRPNPEHIFNAELSRGIQ